MATVHQRVRGRPAHPSGPTFLAYTPNGQKLITAGSNNVVRVYETGSDGEPINIDDCQENNAAVAATNDFFITGAEDGTVCLYSLETNQYEKMLTRCTLPVRDLALSKDGRWAAVASDEITVKIVNTEDILTVLHLRDHPKPAKHVTFHPDDTSIAVSCTDGIVYIYKMSTEKPELLRKIDGVIRALETEAEASSRAAWHPDGRGFAAPTATRDVVVISRSDGERQRAFSGTHAGDITALAWSPNGALLATAGADQKVILWETKSQKVLARYDYPGVINIVWHPYDNLVSFTSSEGEVFIFKDFVPEEHVRLLDDALQPAPFLHESLSETLGNAPKRVVNGAKPSLEHRTRRRGTPDSLDDLLGLGSEDEDDFVVDDDGSGYALNRNGKRTNGHLDGLDGPDSKRRQVWQPKLHRAFQAGSTPWRGNRRYLCLNLTGFVWTVDQDTHHTVTVEFYDREFHRDFHFTDPYRYDKACLNENGTLFSCPAANGDPATVYYRPHQTWTARADWRTQLPPGEEATSIALSEAFITVTTSANYTRVYTLFGTPFRVYRQKSSPTITCAAWRDYVLTVSNGALGPDGSPKVVYTIENMRRDEVCQSEDTVALPPDAELRSVFFSDSGDPCIYDSTGVLLVLQHWRTPGQARWVPLLDTKLLERLAGGRKEETYWPVAVAQDRFHCIILKGGDRYPYFPRPLLSEFEFRIPVSSIERPKKRPSSPHDPDPGPDDADADAAPPRSMDAPRLEESFVRAALMHGLLEDLLASTRPTHAQQTELGRRQVEIDKALLQLLNVECREGEDRGMKALELVGLLRDRTGRTVEAARKIAARYERVMLEEKIAELAERRLLGEEESDEVVVF